MYPLVLIKSYGSEKSSDIIKDLLLLNDENCEEPISICFNDNYIRAHKLSICTKYYKTEVLLYECDDINAIPDEVKNKVESCVFYFDSNDINFLEEVESIVKFVQDNNIEVSSLITRNLEENKIPELSYDVLKRRFKFGVNIIDINEKVNQEEPVGYAELLEILKNHVWSTVETLTHNSKATCKSMENEVDVEEALNEFEDLLNKFQQFKDISKTLCREEVLKNAENLAELFANMLNEE